MQEAGKKATIFADNPMLLDEVMRVSAYQEEPSLGADPFYVRWLAEDAADGRLTPDNIATQPKGLKDYLYKWWQEIEASEDNNEPLKDLFATLTIVLGAISRVDLEAINPRLVSREKRNLFNKIISPIRRWIAGDDIKGYALIHPRLRDYITTEIYTDELLQCYRKKLLTFCASWQEHHSLYALQYYAEHLKSAKKHKSLYILARDQTFADIQLKQLPDEPDLLLKTLQLALSCAAEEENAGLMAEFMLKHAQWIEQVKMQESPLEALRQGGLERALKLAKFYEVQRQILWHLLLVWELKSQHRLEEAQTILKYLEQKKLPRFEMRGDIDWQGNFAAYFLAHVFEVSDNLCKNLEYKLLNDYFRRHLCRYLIVFNTNSSLIKAFATALNLSLDIHKISLLLDIAKAQAEISNIKTAATFNKALEVSRKSSLSYWDWLDTIVLIRKTQMELGYIGVLITFNVYAEIAEKFSDPEEYRCSLEYLEKEIKAEIQFGEEVSVQDNQAEKLIQLEYRLCVSKDFITEIDKIDALCQIAYLYADKKQYSTALSFAAKINNYHRRATIQGIIAQAQAEEGKDSAARETFAIPLQMVQGNQPFEPVFLQAIASAGIVKESYKVTSKQVDKDTASISYEIAQKINNPTQLAIALALVAEAFAKTERRDEAKTIFDKAIETAHKIELQKERVDSFKAIAQAQARIKDFSVACQTAQKIELSWTRAEVVEFIAKLQAEIGQWEEAEITLYNGSENLISHFEGQRYVEGRRINIICTKAVLESFRNNDAAQATFSKLLKFARESGNQRDENLSTVVAALAQANEIPTALKIVDEIEDAWEQMRAFSAIALEQFNKQDKKQLKTTLTAALKAKEKIKNEREQGKALQVIAVIQVLAGLGEEAVSTANTILTERNWYLPRIASSFIKTRDCTNFKQLLIPCAYYLDAAYHICEILSQLYPEQSAAVGKVVIDTKL
ncbi:hypothetical protein [Nostoc sp. CALU 546]|uniref:hypothetical protein n=1 Tax=Nostoc sp. CALU 546 TaxID=1867241 RepID=UPI003B66BEF6